MNNMMFWSTERGMSSLDEGDSGATRVVVNVPTQSGLLADLKARFEKGRGFTIATLNLDHVTKLRRMPAFLQAYLNHSHVTADGNPIVWLSRLAGQDVSLIPGSELIDPISQIAAQTGTSVTLFGATQASLDAAAKALEERHPGLEVVNCIAPPMGFDPEGAQADEYISAIKASGAGLVFIALGAPKQEIFAIHAHAQLPQVGFVSIGAGLDFISGQQTRAPRIVRRFAAEWLWRLAANPKRLAARYGTCIVILPGLFLKALSVRFFTKRGAAQ